MFSVSPYTFTVHGGSPRGYLFPYFSHKKGADDQMPPLLPPQSETPVKSALDLPEVLPVGNILKMMNLQILQERAVRE